MKGLVLGSTGQVGESLKQVLPDAAFLNRTQLDLSKTDSIFSAVLELKPSYLVNAAAFTGVDLAEEQEELASRVNGTAVLELSRAATALNIPFIHISTDYVFSGEATRPYKESDQTGPINAYGRSKLMGESCFLEGRSDNHWLLRCSWVFSEYGSNFVKTMLRLADQEKLRVVSDQFGRPTYSGDIANVIAGILSSWRNDRALESGVFHCASSGTVSWYEFACEIFSEANDIGLISCKPSIEPIETIDYPTPAMRPRCSVLDTSKLEQTLGSEIPHWKQGLARTLSALAFQAS